MNKRLPEPPGSPSPPSEAPEKWPTSRRLGLRRLSIVWDFALFEMLTASRLGVGLSTFKLVVLTLSAVAYLLTFATALVVVHLWRGAVSAPDAFANQAVLAAGTLNVFTGSWLYLQEALTQRRFAVSRSPNAALFRAMDLDVRHIFAVYRVLRISLAYTPVLLVNVAAVALARPTGWIGALSCSALAAMLAAGYLSVLGRAAINAITADVAHLPRKRLAALACAACFVTGWLLGSLASRVASVGAGSITDTQVLVTLGLLVILCSLEAVYALHRLRGALRVMRDHPYPVRVPSPRITKRDLKALTQTGATPPQVFDHMRLLGHAGRHSWQFETTQTILLTHIMIVMLLGGLALTGVKLVELIPGLEVDQRAVSLAAAHGALVVGMVVTDLSITSVGPGRMALHMRSQWELGASAGRIATASLLFHVVTPLFTGTAIATCVVLGGGAFPITSVSAPLAFAAGAVIADTLLQAPRNADGSTLMNSFGLLVALILALPVVAASISGLPRLGVLSTLYVSCLLLGSFICLCQRVLRHPSTSTELVLDMPPVNLSSKTSP